MKIQIIINENQKKYLLKESLSNIMLDKIKEMTDFSKKVLKESSKQIEINLEFLFGWGAAIGGFMGPINEFVKSKHPELTDLELSLIITAIISLYWGDNKELIRLMIKELKSRNLYSIFKEAKDKSSQLYNTFIKFIESLNIHIHKLTNIMSYTFIIPLLPILWDIAKSGHYDMAQTKEVAIRIAGFTTITVSGIIMKNLLWKLIKRFSN
jgi:effector-binding domain-containing protein